MITSITLFYNYASDVPVICSLWLVFRFCFFIICSFHMKYFSLPQTDVKVCALVTASSLLVWKWVFTVMMAELFFVLYFLHIYISVDCCCIVIQFLGISSTFPFTGRQKDKIHSRSSKSQGSKAPILSWFTLGAKVQTSSWRPIFINKV